MKTGYITLIACILLFALVSCSKKCEDFNPGIIEWMPYKVADKIVVMKNGLPDTLLVTSSEINHTEKIGFGVKCSCEDSYNLKLTSDSLTLEIQFNKSKSVELSQIAINTEWMSVSENLDFIDINGKRYTNVIVYRSVDQKAVTRFDRIVISKSIGIIEIVGKNGKWTITDDLKRNINESDIELKRIHC